MNLLDEDVYQFTQSAENNEDRFFIHFGVNNAPVLNIQIPDQETYVDEYYSYDVPDDVFIDTDFDILLDLSMKSMLPLLYIAGLSKAKFKAGSQSDDRKPHLDLMISLRQGDELDELIAQISYYLSIINRNNERTND